MTCNIKVFRICDVDYVAAETPEAAAKCWKDMVGCMPEDEIEEVSSDELRALTFNDVAPGEPGFGKPGTTRSFLKQLENLKASGEKFPTFFATSEV